MATARRAAPLGSTFHEIGRLFAGEVDEPTTVSSDTPVRDALRLMVENRYSQLPIVDAGVTRGVFSLWSLAQSLAVSTPRDLLELHVEEFMISLPEVTVETSLHSVLSALEEHEAVIVTSAKGGLQAVASTWDVLRYFYELARPFVLLGEIELALRDVITVCTGSNLLADSISKSIAQGYVARGQPIPAGVHDMSFDDYRTLITSRENWPLFDGVLGRNRERVATRLETVRELRNRVFHFRNDISVLDHSTLATTRDWLLERSRRAAASGDGPG
jgi:CBS domain-containing protein